MSRWWWLIACGACAPKVAPEAAPQQAAAGVVQSPVDQRQYRDLVLDNGMKVMLVSDADTDMAAASLAVHVGHYADPPDRQGLAHFLEHMLFMGTEKYPNVDDFQSFIQSNGGASNAGTGGETTGYFFRVEHSALPGAFDRFAQFFVSPLLDPTYVDRERHAVHNEYFLKRQQEDRRTRQVRKVTTNPEHPESKFSVGNLDTLADRDGDPVYEDVRALYAAEYRPDRMAVAVLGRESLDALEAMVRAGLEPVAGAPAPRAPRPPPYRDDQLGVRIDIVPLAERREIELQFPLPPSLPRWPERTHDAIERVLGHEGEGTLAARLKEAGYAEWLRVSNNGADDYDLVTVSVGLTEAGAAHVDLVVASVFEAIRAMAADARAAERYAEIAAKADLDFAWAEEVPASDAVEAIADRLLYFPPANALNAPWVFGPFDAAAHQAALAAMTPGNARLLVVLPDAVTDRVEPLYDVPYAIRPLTDAERATYAADGPLDIQLPALNPWMPRATEVRAGGGSPTRLSADGAALELWHYPDDRFGVPRAAIHLSLPSAAFRGDARAWVTGRLVERVVEDALADALYPMQQAGIQVWVGADADGLWLSARGYDDRLPDAYAFVLDALAGFAADPQRVAVAREGLARSWRNQTLDRPSAQTGAALADLLYADEREERSLVAVLEALGPADVEAALRAALAPAGGVLFVHGNLDARAAQAIADATAARVRWSPAPLTTGVRSVPAGVEVVRDLDLDHNDSAISVAWVSDDTSDAQRARFELLGGLLRSPFFSQLRTTEQLGYVVGATARRYDRHPALVCVVQSSTAAPDHLLARTDAFLEGFAATLADMSDEAFATTRDGVRARLLEADTRLFDASDALIGDLSRRRLDFAGDAATAAALDGITREDLLAFYRTQILGDPGRIVVRSLGDAHASTPMATPGCPDEACAEARLGPVRERPLR